MTNDQSTVEKDDVLPPKPLPPPLSIFPLQPFVPDSQTRLTHSSRHIQDICLPLIIFLIPDGMMNFVIYIYIYIWNSMKSPHKNQ